MLNVSYKLAMTVMINNGYNFEYNGLTVSLNLTVSLDRDLLLYEYVGITLISGDSGAVNNNIMEILTSDMQL